MALRIPRQSAPLSLSLTPLIDVVFQLLIFFLVATQFAEEDRELRVDLPSASHAQPLIVKPQEIFINIDAEGRYKVGRDYLSVEQLRPVLSEAHRNNPLNQSVTIRADKNCRWDHVAVAIDACHLAGIHQIKLPSAARRQEPQ